MPNRIEGWGLRLKAATSAVVLVAGTGVAAIAAVVATTGTAASAAVPAPPAGFTLTWSDDFNGAAGTGLDTGTWKYDTGPGSSFGTGEIETMTNSTSNVFQDGNGHLVLRALHSGTNPTSGWTSGRDRDAGRHVRRPGRRRGADGVAASSSRT